MTFSFADAIRPRPPASPPEPRPAIIAATATPYGQTALRAECDTVASTPAGARNAALNKAAFSVMQLVNAGHVREDDAQRELLAAARAAGLPELEAVRTIRSAAKGADGKPRMTVPDPSEAYEPPVNVTEVQWTADDREAVRTLWQERPILTHIRAFALSRMVSPAAVLGVTLLRALALVPPTVVLPPLIGGFGSVNLFLALVASSGAGKGAAESCSDEAFWWPREIFTATAGSGEGIAHCYAHVEKDGQVWDRRSVLFTVPEVDTLAAINARQGSTLLAQLRSAFSGEQLGFSYADRTRKLSLPKHQYRLGMIVGVQPEKAGSLLNDADGGTPQRFIWMRATDPDITDDPEPSPAPWGLTLPDWTHELRPDSRTGLLVVQVPDVVRAEIRANHAARARGEGTALDGHAMFAREKVAFALAVLDGRARMDEDDWRLSAAIMAMSDQTRAGIQHTLAIAAQRRQDAEVAIEIRRTVTISEATHARGVERVRATLERRLSGGPLSRRDLQRSVASRDRDYFEDALQSALDLGLIVNRSTVDGSLFELGEVL